MAIYKIQASRVNNINATEFTGQENELGQIWYDPVDGVLRLYDGAPGGKIINGGSGGNYSNANVAAYLPVNDSNVGANNVTATGNVTGSYFIGNGALLTGVVTDYGNANVAAFLADLGTNAVTTTANVSANYFIGNGSLLTGINSNYSNANVAAYLPTYTGTLTADSVTATGNVTAAYFIGDGSQLTNVGVNAAFPPQAGNANAYLTTNGSSVLWQYLPGAFGLELDGGNAQTELEYVIDGGGA